MCLFFLVPSSRVLDEGCVAGIGTHEQLMAIARAILANPTILILDEATSSGDTRTELEIQKAMETLMRGRTSVIIAHRLSTVKGCDSLVYLNKGRVEATGSYEELQEKVPAFKAMTNG